MTDITRLLASLKRRSAHAKEFGDSITFVKLKDIDALVEALEKAQKTEKTLESRNRRLDGIITAAEKRIAELESRAVTVENLQESAYRAGLTAGWNLGLANNDDGFNKCLAAHAAGIKVEAE